MDFNLLAWLTIFNCRGTRRDFPSAFSRRTHYEAVAELRNLAGRFLRQQILTHFQDNGTRLAHITTQAEKLPGKERKHAIGRVKMLRSWEKNAKRILPLLLRILGNGR